MSGNTRVSILVPKVKGHKLDMWVLQLVHFLWVSFANLAGDSRCEMDQAVQLLDNI